MRFNNETEAITYVFKSLAAIDWRHRGLDEDSRDPSSTQQLLSKLGLPKKQREYAVVTGSKGKGSVSAITARLLQSLGHTVGLVTSPHLTTYRQRFRINGTMISEAELVRLINEIAPTIDLIQSQLAPGKYLSPQGVFLAMALKWFDENDVTVAIIEVGRGGRFDDNAVVSNALSMFTPILLEHTRYMGPTVERIAWHKAGIIKPDSQAFSLPQSPMVMRVLQKEATEKHARFTALTSSDTGTYLEPLTGEQPGMRVAFGPYGRVDFPMSGRYEINNASLAIRGAGFLHNRITLENPIPQGSSEYIRRIRHGLENVFWPGRCQRLQDNPTVYVDGAINTLSAQAYLGSVQHLITKPVITVLAVPRDRDYPAVYSLFAPISDTMILTETDRNITITFPEPETALAEAHKHHENVLYEPTIAQALETAKKLAGESGTVLMSLAQPAIGDLMLLYGQDFAQI